MAKVRIGYGTDFSLENELVGIGTDTPVKYNLDLRNNSSNLLNDYYNVGVATIGSSSGFLDNKQTLKTHSIIDNRSVGSISAEIIIDGEVTVSSGSTIISGVETLTVTDNFTLPGITDDKPTVGTTRFNENLGALEFYTGVEWRAVNSYIDSGNRGRCLIMGGSGTNAKHLQTIDYVSIPTTGNAISFGDLLEPVDGMGACSSSIRAVTFGGTQNPGSSNTTVNTMQYVTIQSSGNSINFGDLQGTHRYPGSATNGTRAIVFGGSGNPSYREEIEFFNISTLGNSIDTGGTARRTSLMEQVYSPTRAIFVSGYTPSNAPSNGGTVNNISKFTHYINITSAGNTTDFGEMYLRSGSGMSNRTRGIIGGGGNPTFPMSGMYYITIASLGNFEYFGEMVGGASSRGNGNASSQTRGLFCGGSTPAPSRINNIEYVTFSALGNAVDFGDLTSKCADGAEGVTATSVTSDSHGGLGGF